ncbi:MAG: sulfatase-like hydrolase/transferase [Planctomycetes bacterium]|nr:sulfatase-like hydrolase/transferase [Planctomycetota bacterium]
MRITNYLRRAAVAAIILGALTGNNPLATAIQPDAPYVKAAEQNQAQWAEEDKQIERKLEALRQRFGKRPNIIYILADDVGWGEMGWQGGGKHRGTPTPTLDRMALEGMRFWCAYAEPSCTPSRIAIMTGRHPVRTGLLSVLWPGQTDGLSGKEVTAAEVLSQAGYNTAMWGKWHLGEEPEHLPENQGFDYAYYGLWNGAPDNWPLSFDMYKDGPSVAKAPFYDFPGTEEYKKRTGIDLSVAGYVGRKGKGRKPIEGAAGKLGPNRQEAFEAESIKQITAYIKDSAKGDNPFFIYWATYTQQLQGSKAHHNDMHVDKVNAQASEMAAHNAHVKQLLDTLKDVGIAENTLVVWISDNGPMYAFYPNSGYSWLRGEKGDVLEGGVRVPAMAWWPGMIEPNQDPIDKLHITDLFTTAARLGGALDNIPSDRVTDGIDQTALFLLGEGHGRRQTIFHYSGGVLGAIRYDDFKVHLKAAHGGLPGMDFYNVMRDPGEKFGELYPGLFAVTPIQIVLREHMKLIEKFPHRVSEVTPKGAELTPHD